MVKLELTEQEANLLGVIMSDITNGDLLPVEGIEYDRTSMSRLAETVYATIDTNTMFEKAARSLTW